MLRRLSARAAAMQNAGRAGEEVEFEQVLADIRRRDEYDSTRQHAPLIAASDAVVVDSTGLTIQEVLERVKGLIEQRS